MRLLLIHTGGTIGMAEGPSGLAPVAGLVEKAVSERLPQGTDLTTHVFNPLLDSADVGPDHWNEILRMVRAHQGIPVVVTHGTDTMAFTGAALAQALAGEERRIILCGSMLPLGQNGDAETNLDLAIKTAFAGQVGVSVSLAFAGKLLPADGLVKHDSGGMDAFRSQPQTTPHLPLLRHFDARKLAILTLTPGLSPSVIRASLSELDGAVLRVFGSGTAPADPELIGVLADAVAAGKRIRAVSQCEAGGLAPGAYAAGAGLWAAGVENGGVETPEAALIQLWLN
jgi:L-asparaginase